MSIIDKVTGKVKQALGDVTEDPTLREEGLKEEKRGRKKQDLHQAEQEAELKEREAERRRKEVARLER